jgi:HD-like signal output (HDOD) protein
VKTETVDLPEIPPRPALLMALQREMSKEMPHFKKIAEVISRDAAIAGNLLQTANSAFYSSANRRIATVSDAITLIGLDHCSAVTTGLITRRVLNAGAMMMTRFWDVSEKRAKGMSFIAKATKLTSIDVAYSFGLFCDIGIPLMKTRFNTYLGTLSAANRTAAAQFLKTESDQHGTNHAELGALLAEKWGIAETVVQAIRAHHTPLAPDDQGGPNAVQGLVAMNLLVERAIQVYRREESLEWRENGQTAMAILSLSDADVDDLCDELVSRFSPS